MLRHLWIFCLMICLLLTGCAGGGEESSLPDTSTPQTSTTLPDPDSPFDMTKGQLTPAQQEAIIDYLGDCFKYDGSLDEENYFFRRQKITVLGKCGSVTLWGYANSGDQLSAEVRIGRYILAGGCHDPYDLGLYVVTHKAAVYTLEDAVQTGWLDIEEAIPLLEDWDWVVVDPDWE